MTGLLIYGSYGYTGRLIATEAVERGFDPVLAGRDGNRVREQAGELGCESLVFEVNDPGLAQTLETGPVEVDTLLNCAGPFADTAEPLVEACLSAGVDYLDITGEIEVFEALAARDGRATEVNVTVLPGVGFDVVPSDCLAAHLARRLPDADHLTMGFPRLGRPSPGTAKTSIRGMTRGAVRRDGEIVEVPPAHETREIDFGDGPRLAVTIPWGDVSTAYHSTGIPNVEFYMGIDESRLRRLRLLRYLRPVIETGPVQRLLEWWARRSTEGPDEAERRKHESVLWGEARTRDGERVVSHLRGPNPYDLTVDAALTITERVLDGEVEGGFLTPSLAFGSEFVLELDGVERVDIE